MSARRGTRDEDETETNLNLCPFADVVRTSSGRARRGFGVASGRARCGFGVVAELHPAGVRRFRGNASRARPAGRPAVGVQQALEETSALQAQEEPLARQAARVTGELAALADDAVAGHDHAQRVASDGRADVFGQYLTAQLAGKVAVGDGVPVRDAVNQVPDAAGEFIAARVEGEVEALPPAGEVLGELAFSLVEPSRAAAAEGRGVR